jgi:hypothetical protein
MEHAGELFDTPMDEGQDRIKPLTGTSTPGSPKSNGHSTDVPNADRAAQRARVTDQRYERGSSRRWVGGGFSAASGFHDRERSPHDSPYGLSDPNSCSRRARNMIFKMPLH